MTDTLDLALTYAERYGWPVIPLHSPNGNGCTCGRDDCSSPAKHPRTRRGLSDATTDPVAIRAWWSEWSDANVGVRTDRLVVLDVDGPEGEATLEALEAEHGTLETLTARTGRGRHLLFEYPSGVTIRPRAAALGEGLDVRAGDGSYIVAPSSRHISGATYSWDVKRQPALLPEWLTDRLTDKPAAPRTHPASVEVTAAGGSPYARAALEAEARAVASTPEGSRNHRLNAAAYNLGQLAAGGEIDTGTIEQTLMQAAAACGLGERESRRTIASGLEAGQREPRTAPEPAPRVATATTIDQPDLPPGPPEPTSWPDLDDAALYGLPGHVVSTLEPHTEADPVALLLSYLVAFGSAVSAGPHAVADGSPHPARLYAVLVGETSRARKGTSWSQIKRVLADADPVWMSERIIGGLASGEGLIAMVRDPEPEDDDAPPVRTDKRLLVVEPEYARVLAVAERRGNTLSAIIREAWDSGNLAVTTRQDPLRARGAHVSIIGHVTLDELRRRMLDTEAANGFANRFLLACVRRSKLLPSGGNLRPADAEDLARLTRALLIDARKVGTVRRSDDAEALWRDLYRHMAENAPAGLVGAVTARAEAQTLRLSVAYALTDASNVITVDHLRAAWAVWQYCEQSAAYIFGDSLGDEVADRLLEALREAGDDGLDGTQQRDLFGRHASGARLEAARKLLESRGLAVTTTVPTGGRPRTVTYATEATEATEGVQL